MEITFKAKSKFVLDDCAGHRLERSPALWGLAAYSFTEGIDQTVPQRR
jgi:hypothetical protein